MEGEGDEIKSKQASKRDMTLIIHFGLTLPNKCKILIMKLIEMLFTWHSQDIEKVVPH